MGRGVAVRRQHHRNRIRRFADLEKSQEQLHARVVLPDPGRPSRPSITSRRRARVRKRWAKSVDLVAADPRTPPPSQPSESRPLHRGGGWSGRSRRPVHGTAPHPPPLAALANLAYWTALRAGRNRHLNYRRRAGRVAQFPGPFSIPRHLVGRVDEVPVSRTLSVASLTRIPVGANDRWANQPTNDSGTGGPTCLAIRARCSYGSTQLNDGDAGSSCRWPVSANGSHVANRTLRRWCVCRGQVGP